MYVVYVVIIHVSITTVYRSPEYDILAYKMALDRLVDVGYPIVRLQLYWIMLILVK